MTVTWILNDMFTKHTEDIMPMKTNEWDLSDFILMYEDNVKGNIWEGIFRPTLIALNHLSWETGDCYSHDNFIIIITRFCQSYYDMTVLSH